MPFKCPEKAKQYRKERYLRMKDQIKADAIKRYHENREERLVQMREYHKNNRDEQIAKMKARRDANDLGRYCNYYIPSINYTGITRNFECRKSKWKSRGVDVEDMRIIGSSSKTRSEAQRKENIYHQTLGWRIVESEILNEFK